MKAKNLIVLNSAEGNGARRLMINAADILSIREGGSGYYTNTRTVIEAGNRAGGICTYHIAQDFDSVHKAIALALED